MKLGTKEYKIFRSYVSSNPGCTVSDWVQYYNALKECLDIRS